MAPLTRNSRATFNHFDPGSDPGEEEETQSHDVDMTMEDDKQEDDVCDVMKDDPVSAIEKDRIVIAIDFGTTFSAVAYTVLKKGTSPEDITVQKVKCIGNYPGYEAPPGMPDVRQDVPTELWYDDRSFQERDYSMDGAESSESEDEPPDAEPSGVYDYQSDEGPSEFEDESHPRRNATTPIESTETAAAPQYWGFQVQQRLNSENIPRDDARPLTRFKLKLDETQSTSELRSRLDGLLSALREKRIIRKDSDIYTDYLTHLLKHAKEQLQGSNELQEGMVVQFVLCVPAKWPTKACQIMQKALEDAVKNADLGEEAQKGVLNIFMISEPEAAAECILAEERSELYRDETVVIVDAGGGTIDAVTYKCTNDEPLRLSEEVVPPDSRLFGASLINEKFEAKLLQKLSTEHYLAVNGKSLKSIVQVCSTKFENNEKRKIDVSNMRTPIPPITVDNLRPNIHRRFYQNRLELKRKTVRGFYEESLKGAEDVLESQLELAESEDHRVQKVILTGGFGQSPSLQSHLRTFLQGRKNLRGWDIDLIVPRNPSTAVARGAVLRALNKRFGPSRISQCSYGILLSEPYLPDFHPEHRKTRCRINKADGERYVDQTIRWVIRAGERVENMQEFPFVVKHTFSLGSKNLLAAEELWMSDKLHPDHYRKTHASNKGAVAIGEIVADLTKLREKGLIKPQTPSEFSTHYGSRKKYWEVHYEVVMTVEGRSIQLQARWPPEDDLVEGQKQETFDTQLVVGISAAFKPGTA